MATGDVTISVAVAGGVTKSVTLDSATKDKVKLQMSGMIEGFSDDADWQVYVINDLARKLINQANAQLKSETTYTAKTFTAAS